MKYFGIFADTNEIRTSCALLFDDCSTSSPFTFSTNSDMSTDNFVSFFDLCSKFSQIALKYFQLEYTR